MSVQNKPDYKIFASGAKPGEVVAFPDILRGWGVTLDTTGGIPPMEFFNSSSKRLNEWLMYLTQRGIPEWDSSVEYPKSAVVMLNGKIYISLKQGVGNNPSSSQIYWDLLDKYLGVTGKVDYGNHTITGGVDSSGNGSVNAANGGIRFYRKKDGTLTLYSREKADGDSGYVTEVELPKKKGVAALTSDLTDKIDYGIHVITGGVDSSGRGSVNAANGSVRLHRDENGTITIYGRKNTDDSSDYTTSVSMPKSSGVAALTKEVIGIGQSWKNETSTRKKGVSYTNNNTKTIFVNIVKKPVGSTGGGVFVDGMSVGYLTDAPSADRAFTVSFLVPPGSTYKTDIDFINWYEFS